MRQLDGTIIFKDYPEFRPNLTPRQIFSQGAFGGTYFRPIYSSVIKKSLKNRHYKYKFLDSIDKNLLCRDIEDVSLNKFGVHSGTSLEYWEYHNWIKPQDPYGWVQWYCEFYSGRRSPDDERQIKRWLSFAGPKGRFRLRLIGICKAKKTKLSDTSVSPVIRQGLHQWAYELK